VLKRCFDIVVSLTGLILLTPLFLLIAVLIVLDSPGPVFFQQERMGKNFRPFQILKFRTMVTGPPDSPSLTIGRDPRITRLGGFLRKSKLDELPQLINVLRGDMSLVGPRPEVREFVEMFPEDYIDILSVRPGITDLASIEFSEESEILGQAENPLEFYRAEILPRKIQLAKKYIREASFWFDLRLILRTATKIWS